MDHMHIKHANKTGRFDGQNSGRMLDGHLDVCEWLSKTPCPFR